MHTLFLALLFAGFAANGAEAPYAPPQDLPQWLSAPATRELELGLANVLPPLLDEDDPRSMRTFQEAEPIADTLFTEHVRRVLSTEERDTARARLAPAPAPEDAPVGPDEPVAVASCAGAQWLGCTQGLFRRDTEGGAWVRHASYGVNGPLASAITALAPGAGGVLWVGTPLGLSVRALDGAWRHLRGRDGLPVEHITALAVNEDGSLWIGTVRGAVLYRPGAEGRQWFYRAGGRYLAGDRVRAIAAAPGGMPVYFDTDGGICAIDTLEHTLAGKADTLEARLNHFHRRLGLVVESVLDDPHAPTMAYTSDGPNDGLWTSYHVTAMSLAYGATGETRYRDSAKEGMDAMIRLQNATGVPGLPARTIVPPEIGTPRREAAQDARDLHEREQWRPTPDGKYYWRSDTSNDEVDGHFLALYSYWRHIARHNPAEQERIAAQTRALAGHIIEHGYRLHDWDGKPTTWGYWNPGALNDDPSHYLENGLGSLQLLSFMKTAYAVTGDAKYQEHYLRLIEEHGYLSNLQLEKKVWPDMNNHSDDQLAYVAWYPLLQLEWDPAIRRALHRAVRRHYKIIEPKRSSFFYFVTATIDPGYVRLEKAVQNLRNIPTDRRMWRVENSHRADVHFEPRPNRFGRPVLERVLRADERDWAKWNQDPYEPDGGGPGRTSPAGVAPPDAEAEIPASLEYPDGAYENDGGSWLLAYWLGRYHGFILPPQSGM